jgi:alpha-L-rhamnosidase
MLCALSGATCRSKKNRERESQLFSRKKLMSDREPELTKMIEWIYSPSWAETEPGPPAGYVRTRFDLARAVHSARLQITALGLYRAFINSLRVGDIELTPGWTDYRKRVYVQTFDVTDLLRVGRNALGVMLGEGWYCGRVAEEGHHLYGHRAQLLVQLDIQLQDGSCEQVVTGSEWKAATGPITANDLLMGESYDARLELGDWAGYDYEDTAWSLVELAPAPGIELQTSPGVPVRCQERLAASGIPTPSVLAPDVRLYDLGQNMVGRICLQVQAERGRELIIRHAEVLNPDGTLYTENLRNARATDRYICAGTTEEVWEPAFTFHGFRYVEISGLHATDTCRIEGVVLHSDMRGTGHFECSHPLINQLEHNILWGQKGNFLEVPTDCPQRDERLGWTGDAQVFIRTACFHMDVLDFFRKWLQDMRDAQHEDGGIPAVVPNLFSSSPGADGGPAWADAAFICPWTLYRCYGALDVLEDHYDCMVRYMAFLNRHRVLDHIRPHPDLNLWGGFGDWLALDGSGKVDGGTPKDLIGTAFYANNADIMTRTAALLGKTDDAARYHNLHESIVRAFRRRFVTPEGLVVGHTQTSYVLALHFGLLPESARAVAAAELVRNIRVNKMHLATGFVGTPYLLHVLEATGHLDVAYALLEQDSFPSWLFPVKNGATTIWEHWDGWTPEQGFKSPKMNSFNHYAYGAVGDWLVSTVAGLELHPEVPAYRHIVFKPRPGGNLTNASAQLETPQGLCAIRWERQDDQTLELNLVVPPGSQATLDLPSPWQAANRMLESGEHKIVATAKHD